MTPTDPLYRDQWHFDLLGDIERIWDEFSGAGIHVGVYDNGIDYLHPDLDGNYDGSRHILDGSGDPVDPFPGGNDFRGTAAAGLIGAEADNGTGGVGVAHGVSLTGVNIFDPAAFGYIDAADPSGFFDAVRQAADAFDVMSNSWSSAPRYLADQNLNGTVPDDFTARLEDAYEEISQQGRGGLGTVIVQAAGDTDNDVNGDGVNVSRHTITVAASDEDGDATAQSNWGSAILVTAPGGSVTTDLRGGAGADPGDYTDLEGTEAAAPIVSGIVALMLEANPDLGWRDVQAILATSASHTGSDLGGPAAGFEIGPWQFNGADSWNGGGMHVSGSYGYGMVNAYNAVRMAEVWHLFDEAQTSANEMSARSSTFATRTLLPDGNATGRTFSLNVTADLEIEHVALHFGMDTTWVGDLAVFVTTPDGTTVQVMYSEPGLGPSTNVDAVWTLGIDHLRGESSAGEWTLRIADTQGADANYVDSLQLEIFGTEAGVDDVHHYTDEIFDLVDLDGTREQIVDTNGGTDWLNFAAIAERVSGSLAVGAAISIGSQPVLEVAPGSLLENAVLGDGDDSLDGNDLDNHLVGMRGDDTLNGLDGDDTLEGGTGDDRLDGGEDRDRLFGNEGADTLFGGTGGDWIYGGIGADTVGGGRGRDHAELGQGADVYTDTGQGRFLGQDTVYGEAGNDRIDTGGGSDLIYGGRGNDTVIAGDGRDVVELNAGNDRFVDTDQGGAAGRDTVDGGRGNDTILGGGGGDSLSGGVGRDAIEGGSGGDRIHAGGGNDSVDGGLGRDVVDLGGGNDSYADTGQGGFRGQDRVLGGTGDDRIDTGAGNDRLEGQLGDDVLRGRAGDDLLDGGRGDDTLTGGSGIDRVIGGQGADAFVFEEGSQTDRVLDFSRGEGDMLLLDAGLWSGALDAQDVVDAFATVETAGVVFDFGGGDLLILEGLGSRLGLADHIEIL